MLVAKQIKNNTSYNNTFDIFANSVWINNCIVYNLYSSDFSDYGNISELIKEVPKNLTKVEFLEQNLFSLKLAFDEYQNDELYLKVYDVVYFAIYQLYKKGLLC